MYPFACLSCSFLHSLADLVMQFIIRQFSIVRKINKKIKLPLFNRMVDVCLSCFLIKTFLFVCFFLNRFVLVFGCLVLSVFSTIPEHQEMSSRALFILVRMWDENSYHIRHCLYVEPPM